MEIFSAGLLIYPSELYPLFSGTYLSEAFKSDFEEFGAWLTEKYPEISLGFGGNLSERERSFIAHRLDMTEILLKRM